MSALQNFLGRKCLSLQKQDKRAKKKVGKCPGGQMSAFPLLTTYLDFSLVGIGTTGLVSSTLGFSADSCFGLSCENMS
jgi:hypothetical protein